MALIFVDTFKHYEHKDLPRLFFDPQANTPKHPGVFTIEAKDDGTAEVVRQFNGETETRILAAGESAWGIEWTGTGHNVTEEAWEKRMAAKALERQGAIIDPGPMPAESPPCCTEWRVDGTHGWQLFLTCGLHQSEGCDHKHHDGEVWIA